MFEGLAHVGTLDDQLEGVLLEGELGANHADGDLRADAVATVAANEATVDDAKI